MIGCHVASATLPDFGPSFDTLAPCQSRLASLVTTGPRLTQKNSVRGFLSTKGMKRHEKDRLSLSCFLMFVDTIFVFGRGSHAV